MSMPDKNHSSTSSDDTELATPSEAADYLRTTPAKLAQDRFHGIGPTYVKLHGRVLYPWAELRQYVENSKIIPRRQLPG